MDNIMGLPSADIAIIAREYTQNTVVWRMYGLGRQNLGEKADAQAVPSEIFRFNTSKKGDLITVNSPHAARVVKIIH